MQRRDLGGRHAGDRARDRLRAETRSVHDSSGGDTHGRRAVSFDNKASPSDVLGEHGSFERDHGAMGFGVATQRQREGIAVDDSCRRRQQRPLRDQRGLERARLLAAQPGEIGGAVSLGLALSAASLSTSPAFTATRNLPHRLCGTRNSGQNA